MDSLYNSHFDGVICLLNMSDVNQYDLFSKLRFWRNTALLQYEGTEVYLDLIAKRLILSLKSL